MKKYHIEYRLFFVKKLEDRIRYKEVILCKFFHDGEKRLECKAMLAHCSVAIRSWLLYITSKE